MRENLYRIIRVGTGDKAAASNSKVDRLEA